MKKTIVSITCTVLALCILLVSAACSNEQQRKVGSVKLVVGTEKPTVYVVDFDEFDPEGGVMSVLKYLHDTEGLEYKCEESAYGAYLLEIGELKQSENTYIYLYTSIEADRDVSEYATTIEFEGTTLYSSGLGISQMTLEDGCTIYIGSISY